MSYVVQVDPTATAHPVEAVPVAAAYSGRGRRPKPAYPDPPVTFKDLVLRAGRSGVRPVTWRRGIRKTATNRTAAITLCGHPHPPGQPGYPRNDGAPPEQWLIAEWPPGEPEPVK